MIAPRNATRMFLFMMVMVRRGSRGSKLIKRSVEYPVFVQ